MPVPLLDLKPQFAPLRDAILSEMTAVVDSQNFILGPKVEHFEQSVAEYCGVPHAVGVSSGTDALLAALMALEVGPGDAVITSPYSFFATAGSIARLGATPVFIDIDPATYNLSPTLLRTYLDRCAYDEDGHPATSDGQRIKAVMPVHLYGLAADMDLINATAAEHDLPVIEDAAQALGSEYPRNGEPTRVGALGDLACFSFFPAKNLGCFGDGGMVVCRDADVAERLRVLRNHGMAPQYYHHLIGGNFRLDALQAAILNLKLPHLDVWSEGRRANARRYREWFAEAGLTDHLTLPIEPWAESGCRQHHIYNQFVIRTSRRDALLEHLRAQSIGCAVYYPVPLHRQACFVHLGYGEGSMPESEKAALETLALPIYAELEERQQRLVVEAIADFLS